MLNDENTLLASALHPTIKLGWLADKEKAKEVEGLLVRKLEELKNQRAECAPATSEVSEDSSQSGDDGIADFFKELQTSKKSSAGSQSSARIVQDYLSG